MLEYFTAIWNTFRPFCILYEYPFGNFLAIWYFVVFCIHILLHLGTSYQEKSGNPGPAWRANMSSDRLQLPMYQMYVEI
jgi:hypothetical protein